MCHLSHYFCSAVCLCVVCANCSAMVVSNSDPEQTRRDVDSLQSNRVFTPQSSAALDRDKRAANEPLSRPLNIVRSAPVLPPAEPVPVESSFFNVTRVAPLGALIGAMILGTLIVTRLTKGAAAERERERLAALHGVHTLLTQELDAAKKPTPPEKKLSLSEFLVQHPKRHESHPNWTTPRPKSVCHQPSVEELTTPTPRPKSRVDRGGADADTDA